MARIVQLTDLLETSNNIPALRLEDSGDTLFLGADATIAASGAVASAISLVEGNNDLVIRGTVYSADGSGVSGNLNIPFGDSRVEIGERGFVAGATYGISLLGDGNEVFNAGEIIAGIDGIRAAGAASVVVNGGTIRAHAEGVDLGNDANLTNTGAILGDQVGAVLGARAILANEGLIAGTQPGGVGVRTVGNDITIHNHGRIAGFEAAAIRFEAETGPGVTPVSPADPADGFNTLLNTGTIEAINAAFAVIGSAGIERVDNAGTVIGSISLGGGADLFDGRLGKVLGAAGVGGDAGEDTLLGGDAADLLVGGTEDDEIEGGAGDDIVEGGAGGDLLSGGEGANDRLVYLRSAEGVTVNLGNGLTGGGEARGDVISGFEAITGSAFNDVLIGGNEANRLAGMRGNDLIDGGMGDDRLVGGDGQDTLTGGRGADVVLGGSGADLFVFGSLADSTVNPAGRDRLRDYSQAEGDRMDLGRLDANTGTAANDAFAWLGFGAFTGTAGELRMQWTDGHTLVSADVNGDAAADFAVLLRGTIALVAADFVL